MVQGEDQSRGDQDLAGCNVFNLSDKELKGLILELHQNRARFLNSTVPSVAQMNQQIELAQHELASRETKKLAKLSIAVSLIAIVIATAGVFL